jgi:hypothetical protein
MPPRESIPVSEVFGNAYRDHPLFKWVDAEAKTIPSTEAGGAPRGELDPVRWANYIKYAPNPTIYNTENRRRGEACTEAFYTMGTIVVFLVYEVFFHGILPRMVCPVCEKSDHVRQNGWTHGLRRCASHSANVVLYGRGLHSSTSQLNWSRVVSYNKPPCTPCTPPNTP